MGVIASVILGFSFGYIGLFILALLFFVIGLVANDTSLI